MFEKITQYFERRRLNADFTDFLTSPLAIKSDQIAFLASLRGQDFSLPSQAVTDLSIPKQYRQESNQDGIGIIPILGILEHRTSLFSLLFGGTSYDQIAQQLSEALGDTSIKTIFLDVDSPGGQVSGMFNLVDEIYQARSVKPIYAMVNESAYSAAYAIASAANKIYIPQTGGLGSIGVVSIHIDKSKANEKAGLKYTTIFSGEDKADFSPNAPLSDRARKSEQGQVDNIRNLFAQAVARNRGLSVKSVLDTEAGIYQGQAAVDIGLADGVMSYSDLILQISQAKPKPAGKKFASRFSGAGATGGSLVRLQACDKSALGSAAVIPSSQSQSGNQDLNYAADFKMGVDQERARCTQVAEQVAAVSHLMARGSVEMLLDSLISSGATPEMAGKQIVGFLNGQQAGNQVQSTVNATSTGEVNPIILDAMTRSQKVKEL